MATDSDYLPGASQRANDQVRTYEATDATQSSVFSRMGIIEFEYVRPSTGPLSPNSTALTM